MCEPTTAFCVQYCIYAVIVVAGLLYLGLQFPAECKRKEMPRYDSWQAAMKLEQNRRIYKNAKNR